MPPPGSRRSRPLVQDNTIQAIYWYNLLMVNYTAHKQIAFYIFKIQQFIE